MGNTANWLKLAMAIVLLSEPLEAQAPPGPSSRALITVRGGAQPQRPTVRATHRFDLYDETATLDSVYSIANGPMIDLAVGRRVGRRLVLGGGMSLFRSSGPGAVTAAIPDRVFFDRPRAVTAAASELGRTELGLHAHVAWLAPVSSRFDILLSAGPSIIRLAQELNMQPE